MEGLGRMLISIALILLALGGILLAMGKLGIPRLPGDIYIKRENFTFYFPITTSIIISVILSILFRIFRR